MATDGLGRKVPCALIVLALTGCASYSWTKPGVAEMELKRDQYECWARAQSLPPRPTVLDPVRDAAPRQAVFERCLEAKGYARVKD